MATIDEGSSNKQDTISSQYDSSSVPGVTPRDPADGFGVIENDSPMTNIAETTTMAQNRKDEDDEEGEVARAAAEVAVLQEGNEITRSRRGANAAAITRGEEAMMGAPGEGVSAFEIIDRTGEMVRIRFQQFLNQL